MENKETFEEAILKILVAREKISNEEAQALQKAFKYYAKGPFDNFLLEKGLVDKSDLLQALAQHYQVPAFDVVGYFFDTFLLHKFPKGFLLRNAIIPLEVDENIMAMIASEPDNPDLLSAIGEHVSFDIRFRVGLRRDICDAVKEFYDISDTEETQDIDSRVEREELRELRRAEKTEEFVPYEEERPLPPPEEPEEE